jgi:dual oxidase
MCKVLAQRLTEKDKDGKTEDEVKIGVFFCGPPVIGEQIADQCSMLSARARHEDRKIEYRFMIEVFG